MNKFKIHNSYIITNQIIILLFPFSLFTIIYFHQEFVVNKGKYSRHQGKYLSQQ